MAPARKSRAGNKTINLCYEPIPFPSKAAAATKASNAELWVEAFAGY
jgi:hypothetical protein